MDPNAVFERNTKFYIPDGDVILAAKVPSQTKAPGPPTYKIFKVHKFLLSLRSRVFYNLFMDSDASAPNDSLEGVPLVELHGDNPGDFAVLLSYIYEPESFLPFRRYDPDVSIAITGAVRLSDKYFLEPLRKRLVSYVVAEWPTTLREWDIQQAEINAIKDTIFSVTTVDGKEVDPDQLLSDRIPEPVSAIVFAREFGCTQILHAAFYRLLQINFKADWSLRARRADPKPNPTDPNPNPNPNPNPDAGADDDDEYTYIPLARWALLSKEDLTQYVRGLHEAEEYEAPLIKFITTECWPSFYDGWESDPDTACYQYLENMVGVFSKRRGGTAARDPLGWLRDCLEHEKFPELVKKHPNRLCENCQVKLRRGITRERQRIWTALVPKWFGLQ
ncbi:hypothetical protein GSI_08661 [Ganoderma sinense ZZ0214-1]|uniref:BTB domain-containing protein n=1 Tax=Ganoderma sinense ZZ0214-1 TaxID=1077348 RepID=A0A2G8S4B4_9APHY|nr:hypothetical protein GSI_08661 [Ganoderma sinense ZZ0214-1]